MRGALYRLAGCLVIVPVEAHLHLLLIHGTPFSVLSLLYLSTTFRILLP